MRPIKLFFFDTETNGLQPNGRIVEFGYIICEYDIETCIQTISTSESLRFKPFSEIPEACTKVHWITNDDVKDCPRFIEAFLTKFVVLAKEMDYIIGHNVNFDMDMIEAECGDYLKSRPDKRAKFQVWKEETRAKLLDTMLASIELCNLPWKRWPKWPKLQELHVKLFWQEFDGAHWAMADIEATARCFFELLNRGLMKVSPNPFQ